MSALVVKEGHVVTYLNFSSACDGPRKGPGCPCEDVLVTDGGRKKGEVEHVLQLRTA